MGILLVYDVTDESSFNSNFSLLYKLLSHLLCIFYYFPDILNLLKCVSLNFYALVERVLFSVNLILQLDNLGVLPVPAIGF